MQRKRMRNLITTGTISNEQDFDAVATAQTVESDAERIAANRAKYIVIDVQALPMRTRQPAECGGICDPHQKSGRRAAL